MATAGLGLSVLLFLFHSLEASLFPAVLALVQQTAPSWGVVELDQLMAFIIGSRVLVHVRADLLALMLQLWTQRTIGIQHLCGTKGFDHVFCLLDSPSDELRCSAIQLLGLTLDDSKCQKAFAKVGGFESLSKLLGCHDLRCSRTPTTLLQMALGRFRPDSPASATGCKGASGDSGIIVHVQAVQVLAPNPPMPQLPCIGLFCAHWRSPQALESWCVRSCILTCECAGSDGAAAGGGRGRLGCCIAGLFTQDCVSAGQRRDAAGSGCSRLVPHAAGARVSAEPGQCARRMGRSCQRRWDSQR